LSVTANQVGIVIGDAAEDQLFAPVDDGFEEGPHELDEIRAFLDDIGRNLKTARALGMATIKVDEPEQALRELGTLLGLDLVS
jgi:hypothetical protein